MLEDITGQQFGRLVAVRRVANRGRRTFWLFTCACGGSKEISVASVKRGLSKSCGCLYAASKARGRLVHGGARAGRISPEFISWAAAKGRCTNPNDAAYPDYGGRGITMHPTWLNDFAAFREHMGPRPPRTTLDRIDNERGYEPGNCRWATRKQQARNRRTTKQIAVPLADYAELVGVPYKTLWQRMRDTGETAPQAATHFKRLGTV